MARFKLIVATLVVAAAGCGPMDPDEAELGQAASSGGVSSFTLSVTALTAGGSLTASVSAGSGAIVYLGFPKTVLAGPKFVRIPSGRSSATVTFYSNPYVSAATTATISASTSSPQPWSYVTRSVLVSPAPSSPSTPRPQVASVAFTPSSVATGTASTGTVTLTGPAPAGGAVVQLGNSNDSLNLDVEPPPVAIVPAGATSAEFTVATHLSNSVATSVRLPIVANYFGGTFQGAYLTVTR